MTDFNEIKRVLKENDIDKLRALLKSGFDINQRDKDGNTILMLAQNQEQINAINEASAGFAKESQGNGDNNDFYRIRSPHSDEMDNQIALVKLKVMLDNKLISQSSFDKAKASPKVSLEETVIKLNLSKEKADKLEMDIAETMIESDVLLENIPPSVLAKIYKLKLGEKEKNNSHINRVEKRIDTLVDNLKNQRAVYFNDITNIYDTYDGYVEMMEARKAAIAKQPSTPQTKARTALIDREIAKLKEQIFEYEKFYDIHNLNKSNSADLVKNFETLSKELENIEPIDEVLAVLSNVKFHDEKGKISPQFVESNGTKHENFQSGYKIGKGTQLDALVKIAKNNVVQEKLTKGTQTPDEHALDVNENLISLVYSTYVGEQVIQGVMEKPDQFSDRKDFDKFIDDISKTNTVKHISHKAYDQYMDSSVNSSSAFISRVLKKVGNDHPVADKLFEPLKSVDKMYGARFSTHAQMSKRDARAEFSKRIMKSGLSAFLLSGTVTVVGTAMATDASLTAATMGANKIAGAAIGTTLAIGSLCMSLRKSAKQKGWRKTLSDKKNWAPMITTALGSAALGFAVAGNPGVAATLGYASMAVGGTAVSVGTYKDARKSGMSHVEAISWGLGAGAAAGIGGLLGREAGVAGIDIYNNLAPENTIFQDQVGGVEVKTETGYKEGVVEQTKEYLEDHRFSSNPEKLDHMIKQVEAYNAANPDQPPLEPVRVINEWSNAGGITPDNNVLHVQGGENVETKGFNKLYGDAYAQSRGLSNADINALANMFDANGNFTPSQEGIKTFNVTDLTTSGYNQVGHVEGTVGQDDGVLGYNSQMGEDGVARSTIGVDGAKADGFRTYADVGDVKQTIQTTIDTTEYVAKPVHPAMAMLGIFSSPVKTGKKLLERAGSLADRIVGKKKKEKDVVKRTPVDNVIKKEPVKTEVKRTPVDNVIKKEPVKTGVKKTPVENVVVKPEVDKTPVENVVKKEPVKTEVKKAPVENVVKKEPVVKKPVVAETKRPLALEENTSSGLREKALKDAFNNAIAKEETSIKLKKAKEPLGLVENTPSGLKEKVKTALFGRKKPLSLEENTPSGLKEKEIVSLFAEEYQIVYGIKPSSSSVEAKEHFESYIKRVKAQQSKEDPKSEVKDYLAKRRTRLDQKLKIAGVVENKFSDAVNRTRELLMKSNISEDNFNNKLTLKEFGTYATLAFAKQEVVKGSLNPMLNPNFDRYDMESVVPIYDINQYLFENKTKPLAKVEGKVNVIAKLKEVMDNVLGRKPKEKTVEISKEKTTLSKGKQAQKLEFNPYKANIEAFQKSETLRRIFENIEKTKSQNTPVEKDEKPMEAKERLALVENTQSGIEEKHRQEKAKEKANAKIAAAKEKLSTHVVSDRVITLGKDAHKNTKALPESTASNAAEKEKQKIKAEKIKLAKAKLNKHVVSSNNIELPESLKKAEEKIKAHKEKELKKQSIENRKHGDIGVATKVNGPQEGMSGSYNLSSIGKLSMMADRFNYDASKINKSESKPMFKLIYDNQESQLIVGIVKPNIKTSSGDLATLRIVNAFDLDDANEFNVRDIVNSSHKVDDFYPKVKEHGSKINIAPSSQEVDKKQVGMIREYMAESLKEGTRLYIDVSDAYEDGKMDENNMISNKATQTILAAIDTLDESLRPYFGMCLGATSLTSTNLYEDNNQIICHMGGVGVPSNAVSIDWKQDVLEGANELSSKEIEDTFDKQLETLELMKSIEMNPLTTRHSAEFSKYVNDIDMSAFDKREPSHTDNEIATRLCKHIDKAAKFLNVDKLLSVVNYASKNVEWQKSDVEVFKNSASNLNKEAKEQIMPKVENIENGIGKEKTPEKQKTNNNLFNRIGRLFGGRR